MLYALCVFLEGSEFLEKFQSFLSFLLVNHVNGKAGMNEDVVAGFGLGSQLETGAPFDPADFNPGHGFLN